MEKNEIKNIMKQTCRQAKDKDPLPEFTPEKKQPQKHHKKHQNTF